ncbi:MAG: homoserine dehydrogenase, partial [Candidatus Omnitrophota bacterium]
PKDIYTEGIEKIDAQDIQYAKDWGYDVKLLGIAKKIGKELDLRVHPTLIPSRNILASVKYEDNAILIKGDMVGETLFYGKGAGSLPTASSVVSDIVDIAKSVDDFKKAKNPSTFEFDSGVKKVREINDLLIRYYLRFSAIDKPGVLSDISKILAGNKISISTVSQKERKQGQPVPLVMLTHEANEGSMKKALNKITKLPSITKKPVMIRIER